MTRIRIVAECILAYVELLGKSQIAENGKGLVDRGQTHRGVEGLQLLVDGVSVRMYLGMGKHIVDSQTLRRHLEAGCAQAACHHTGIEEYGFLPKETILAHARAREAAGANRFAIVTSGRAH